MNYENDYLAFSAIYSVRRWPKVRRASTERRSRLVNVKRMYRLISLPYSHFLKFWVERWRDDETLLEDFTSFSSFRGNGHRLCSPPPVWVKRHCHTMSQQFIHQNQRIRVTSVNIAGFMVGSVEFVGCKDPQSNLSFKPKLITQVSLTEFLHIRSDGAVILLFTARQWRFVNWSCIDHNSVVRASFCVKVLEALRRDEFSCSYTYCAVFDRVEMKVLWCCIFSVHSYMWLAFRSRSYDEYIGVIWGNR
jgi:hypothetical protein